MDEFFTAGVQQPINDGQWHTFRCERRGGVLEGRLDGGEGTLTGRSRSRRG